MKLEDIHQAFISGIYGLEPESLPATYIKNGRSLTAEQSLSVYRGSVFGNLSSALADIYPAFFQCVGEEFFQALALRYVKTHPSRSASLDQYGAEFSNFISTFEPLSSLPYVGDLARLEWFWHRAFHAKDESSLDPLRLRDVSEEKYDELIFTLPQSAQLMISQYPVRDIWLKCLNDKDSDTVDDEQELTLNSGTQSLLIWRTFNYEMRVEELSDLELDLLTLVNKKEKLGTILLELQSNHPVEKINQTLAYAVQQGWFTGFILAE